MYGLVTRMTKSTQEFRRDLRGRFALDDDEILLTTYEAAQLLRRKHSAIWLIIRVYDVPLVHVEGKWLIRARHLPKLNIVTSFRDQVDLALTVSSVLRGGWNAAGEKRS